MLQYQLCELVKIIKDEVCSNPNCKAHDAFIKRIVNRLITHRSKRHNE